MRLRVGMLSVAHVHAWGYAAALKEHPQADFVGAWDESGERLQTFAKSAGVASFIDIDDLLSRVDAVVIASENTKHTGLAQRAAAAGKHILCEKPLVTNETDAATMLELGKKVKVMTAFPCRYSPAFTRLLERVKAGEIGTI